MKAFISWSGESSRSIAAALHTFLPGVLPNVEPWMSAYNIQAGDRWLGHLFSELEEASLGIVVLTPDNILAPWLYFEAGALAKSVGGSRLVPYLIGMEAPVVGPFFHFQAVKADEKGTLKLVNALNESQRPDQTVKSHKLIKGFNKHWPALKGSIHDVCSPKVERGDERDLVESELRAHFVRAYNFNLDPEIGPFNQSIGDFDQSRAYILDAVINNLRQDRHYKYIFAPKPGVPHSDWSARLIEQCTRLFEHLVSNGLESKASLISMTFLWVPSPIDDSVDIHSIATDAGMFTVGFLCRELPTVAVPDQPVIKIRDGASLDGFWNAAEEIGRVCGVSYALSDVVKSSTTILSELNSRYSYDLPEVYQVAAKSMKDAIWMLPES